MMVALRMYAIGCFQNLMAETIGINQSTASRTIHRVTNALVYRMHNWVCVCQRNKKPTNRKAKMLMIVFLGEIFLTLSYDRPEEGCHAHDRH